MTVTLPVCPPGRAGWTPWRAVQRWISAIATPSTPRARSDLRASSQRRGQGTVTPRCGATLAHSYARQHGVRPSPGGLRHASPSTRRAEAASLAREGHQAVVFAGVTDEPREPGGRIAAAEEPRKLAPHEAGQPLLLALQLLVQFDQTRGDDAPQEGAVDVGMVDRRGHDPTDKQERGQRARSPVGLRRRGLTARQFEQGCQRLVTPPPSRRHSAASPSSPRRPRLRARRPGAPHR